MNAANLNAIPTNHPISNTYSNVIINFNGFHNKPRSNNKEINSWTYGTFSFINKNNFIPIPKDLTPSGHGKLFPNHKFSLDCLKKKAIVEILWKISELLHQTTKPQKEFLEHPSIKNVGCSFQINKKLFLTGQKFKQLSSDKIGKKVKGQIMWKEQDNKRLRKNKNL
ncbi:hypothetical protein O181_003143 [Austropuccinia psidii MF-1]|uniref:Tet-like 2OG-Fe(II) oxygenase domain-containing protein n=1 Tax=Austropuccinia psidii MF-1 TaxID=1389203 RepID=A0A9Q3BDV8_9BASI|nr:hypothetical protein [Austropuccinia psidii MF-1]